MRRWFRKKDRRPRDQEPEVAGPPQEESPGSPPPLPEAASLEVSLPAAAPPPLPEPAPGGVSPAGPAPLAQAPAGVEAQPFPESAAPAIAPAEAGVSTGNLLPDREPEAALPMDLEEPAWDEDDEEIIDLEEEIRDDDPEAVKVRKRRFQRFRERLVRTRQSLAGGLERLFLGRRELDADVLDELEELLITADLGVDTTLRLVEVIREKVKRRELNDAGRLKEALRLEMVQILRGPPAAPRTVKPWVTFMVGVNGVGKTTTIAKLAHRDRARGLKPLLVAADTFRAAAVEQLEIWGERAGAQVVKQKTGSDPAAVVFDGLDAAQARGVDVVYVDTAGRLHTKVNLMEELKKVHRTAAKKMPGAPHEILLVLDATTGQNALSQVRLFHEAVGVTGIVLTKLDGTAKGGMALAVAHETGLPIRYVGVGEGMDDLQPFDPEAFVAAILA
jgi:fused signal recognition particle receptor